MEKQRVLHLSRQIIKLLFFISLIMVPQGVAGREYRTSALHQAASVLGIEEQISNAPEGVTTSITLSSGKTISVRINNNGAVEHIGLPIFSQELRRQTPYPVYDCIEYAALDRLFILTENDFLLQKIIFLRGEWKSVLGIKPSDSFTITTHDNKYYQLVWSRNNCELINMVIPVDYELLSGSNRRELEQSFVHNVVRHCEATNFNLTEDIDSQLAKSDIEVDILLSDYARHNISVTLQQWLSYCENLGCTTDIKYDDSDELFSKGYVVSHNAAMGYHHLLELTWQTEIHSKIKGKALLFIPNNDKI